MCSIAERLAEPIKYLELSKRPYRCLTNEFGADATVGQLVVLTEAEILRIPNFGRRSLWELKEVLAQKGLILGMNASELSRLEQVEQSQADSPAEPAVEDNNLLKLRVFNGSSEAVLSKQIVETLGEEHEALTFTANVEIRIPASVETLKSIAKALSNVSVKQFSVMVQSGPPAIRFEFDLERREGALIIEKV